MQTLEFERLLRGHVALDFCFACQLVRFDEHQSTQLAQSLLKKFGRPPSAAAKADGIARRARGDCAPRAFPGGGDGHKMRFLLAVSEVFMTFRLLFLTSIAGLVFGASAQTPAPAVPKAPAPAPTTASTLVAIPPAACVKPEFPGKLASSTRITAFNKEVHAYGDCVKKYVDDVRNIANAATAAGNSAVDEYNTYTNDLKAKVEAEKD